MNNNSIKSSAGWNLHNSYVNLPEQFMTRIEPTSVASPQLVVLNESLAKVLGLQPDALQGPEGIEVFAGNRVPAGSEPIAQAYAGHQFGHFNMLGDGRAVLLGEQVTPTGERVDIQLKGSGPTPYSRSGDGRAALGPMLREYIISEAMHGLGIPTTRSLAVVETGEAVYRETKLPGAILTRVAASHLRVGTFEYAAHFTEEEELQALADYAILRHYPELVNTENRYVGLLRAMIARQAELIARWQLVGFIHGVMNTDNMTISGETIDYGPCAFMDHYDPMTVFSSIDTRGRYAYGNQPYIGGWNLSRFAEALLPLLDENQDQERAVQLAQEALDEYSKTYLNYWMNGMRAKLGLFNEQEEDKALFDDLLSMMHKYSADYTNTFLALTFDRIQQTPLAGTPELEAWMMQWQKRLTEQPHSTEEVHHLMRRSNPAVIPRNHRVEEALEAAVERNDLSVMQELLKVLSDPYAHTPEQEAYAAPPEPSACAYRTFCGT